MRLFDRVSQCQQPFYVTDGGNGPTYRLQGPSDFAEAVRKCTLRYVLTDDLVRICVALAYSHGAKTLDCSDLLHIPAQSVWIEWGDCARREELTKYGFRSDTDARPASGHRGALLQVDKSGRKGWLKVFWDIGPTQLELFASPLVASFDLDAGGNSAFSIEASPIHRALHVTDEQGGGIGVLGRCFSFHFEQSWAAYYDGFRLSTERLCAIERHTLGTTAIDIPIMLVFFLMLCARNSLPQRPSDLSRLNRARLRIGKQPLLEHIEVRAPLIPDYAEAASSAPAGGLRRGPRLHQVRGHLVRRGDTLHWRVPHLRGHARLGAVKSRTVNWTFESRIKSRSSEPDHAAL